MSSDRDCGNKVGKYSRHNKGNYYRFQELIDARKQPIRNRQLGHVTGNQPISGQYFLSQSVPDRFARFTERGCYLEG